MCSRTLWNERFRRFDYCENLTHSTLLTGSWLLDLIIKRWDRWHVSWDGAVSLKTLQHVFGKVCLVHNHSTPHDARVADKTNKSCDGRLITNCLWRFSVKDSFNYKLCFSRCVRLTGGKVHLADVQSTNQTFFTATPVEKSQQGKVEPMTPQFHHVSQ